MKMIMTVAAVALATVAGAGTNYVDVAAKHGNLVYAVNKMALDGELSEPAAFRAALEALDRGAATGKVCYATHSTSRRCPLTARVVMERFCKPLSEKVRADVLAKCGYDAENRPLEPTPGEAAYANYALQSAGLGLAFPASVRTGVLRAAIQPVRRWIRAEGGTFVGKEGAKQVKAKLDALAKELNAPRFGKAGEILKEIGIDVEWREVKSRILGDTEVAEVRTKLMDGETAFSQGLQYRLCVALGVDGYNAFVKEYNEGSKKENECLSSHDRFGVSRRCAEG